MPVRYGSIIIAYTKIAVQLTFCKSDSGLIVLIKSSSLA